jgi:hypothetical protein
MRFPRGSEKAAAPRPWIGPPLRAWAIVGLFVALTGLFAYPLSMAPASRAVNMGADTRLFLWTLEWDLHALARQPLDLFEANIFFPEHRTLAYSENLFGVALLAAPFRVLTGSPLVAMNVVALLSCVLSGLGTFVLARRLRIGVAGALAAGVVFAFSPPRFFRLGQLHLTSVQWIPLCLASLHGYLEEGRRRHLLVAAALFTLQVLSSGHGAVFLALSGSALVAYHALVAGSFSWRRLARDLGPLGLLLLAVNAPFVWPYLAVKREMGFERTLRDAALGAPDAASYVASPAHVQRLLLSLVVGPDAAADAEAYLFPGWLTLALAAAAFLPRPSTDQDRRPRQPRGAGEWIGNALEVGAVSSGLVAVLIRGSGGIDFRMGALGVSAHSVSRALASCAAFAVIRLAWATREPLALRARGRRFRELLRAWSERHGGLAPSFYALLALLTLWASLGPRFGLYSLLYFFPGFDFIRIPSRLGILTLLGLSVLAGLGLERVGRRVSAGRPWFAALVVCLLLVEFAAFPIKARPYVVEIPEVDRWLAGRPGPFVIAEVPVPDPRRHVHSDRLQSLYMVHSTVHWQRMVNGYSGFRSRRHRALFRVLTRFPDEASLRALEELGVRYVVVHRDLFDRRELEEVDRRLGEWANRLTLEHSAGEGRVYRLRGREEGLTAASIPPG